MIKLDIINEVVTKTGITKTKAELAVETVFESMKRSLAKGDRIELRGDPLGGRLKLLLLLLLLQHAIHGSGRRSVEGESPKEGCTECGEQGCRFHFAANIAPK